MRVDETRHDDHVLAVDFSSVDRADIGSDRGDLLAVDKHIGVEMLADGWVHRQNNSVPDDCPLHLRFLFRLRSYDVRFAPSLFGGHKSSDFGLQLNGIRTLTDEDARFKSASIMTPIS